MNVVGLVESAAAVAGIPRTLALACAYAESTLDPRAERWGRRSDEAKGLLATQNWDALQQLVLAVWPDVSFGLAQRIVEYGWCGDRTSSLQNVLSVRQTVFDHPETDVAEMAKDLRGCYDTALAVHLEEVGGDPELGALIIYNAGHWPGPSEPYWQSGRKEHYAEALAWARQQAPGGGMHVLQIGGVDVQDVRDRYPYAFGRSYDERDLSAITAYVQHHTGDGDYSPAMSVDDALAKLDNAYRWHTGLTPGGHDWPSIGYHFGIDGSGRIYYCNNINLVAYHARAANAFGVGVVWLQDLTNGVPNEAMVAAATSLLAGLEAELGRTLNLFGHYECPTNQTDCPGRAEWPNAKGAILTGSIAPNQGKPAPKPADIPGFTAVADDQWTCDLTGGDLAYRMLDLYRTSNGLYWLGYPRTKGWTALPETGRLSKVFQRAVVEIKPQYVAADGTVDPLVPALELFELRLLGDEYLKARGEL